MSTRSTAQRTIDVYVVVAGLEHPNYGRMDEVCDNCGLPVVAVRLPGGRFCSSECAEAFELF